MSKGYKIKIRKGVRLWSTHPSRERWYENGRTRTVDVHHRIEGYSMPNGDVIQPRLVWSGSGGYWVEVEECNAEIITER